MQLPKEARKIIDNSGYYITPTGEVYSALHRRTGGERGEMYIDDSDVSKLAQHIVKGYFQVALFSKRYKVHRLVAQTFLPNPTNKPLVCHKNNNPLDNRVENLYWGNAKDNVRDSILAGTQVFYHKHPSAKLNNEIIEKMLIDKVLNGMTYDQLAIKYKVSRATASKALTGQTYRKDVRGGLERKFTYKKDYILKTRNKIKKEWQKGVSQRALADKYKLGKGVIWRICNDLSYQNVTKKYVNN